MTRALCIILFACLGMGCAFAPRPRSAYEANSQALRLPAVVVFQDSVGSLSYQSPTGADAQRALPRTRVQGRACQRGIQLPLFAPLYALGVSSAAQRALWLSGGWGEGAYRQALEDIRRKLPRGAALVDIRADLNVRMFVSVYREQCLMLDAGVVMPAAEATATAGTLPVAP